MTDCRVSFGNIDCSVWSFQLTFVTAFIAQAAAVAIVFMINLVPSMVVTETPYIVMALAFFQAWKLGVAGSWINSAPTIAFGPKGGEAQGVMFLVGAFGLAALYVVFPSLSAEVQVIWSMAGCIVGALATATPGFYDCTKYEEMAAEEAKAKEQMKGQEAIEARQKDAVLADADIVTSASLASLGAGADKVGIENTVEKQKLRKRGLKGYASKAAKRVSHAFTRKSVCNAV